MAAEPKGLRLPPASDAAFLQQRPRRLWNRLEDLERAIALEPDYATALAYASWAIVRRVTVSLKPLAPAEAAHGLHLTRLALNYGEDDPVVQAIADIRSLQRE